MSARVQWTLLVLVQVVAQAMQPAGAADPSGERPAGLCQRLNNRVLGPRTPERKLPLLTGSAEQGFRRACSADWSSIDPGNVALEVLDCYGGTLLQVHGNAVCGVDKEPLWIDARWVITAADLAEPAARLSFCQHLDTGAYAGTREFSVACAQPPPDTASHAPAHPAVPRDGTPKALSVEAPPAGAAPGPPAPGTPARNVPVAP